jgi:hypothetical protein
MLQWSVRRDTILDQSLCFVEQLQLTGEGTETLVTCKVHLDFKA